MKRLAVVLAIALVAISCQDSPVQVESEFVLTPEEAKLDLSPVDPNAVGNMGVWLGVVQGEARLQASPPATEQEWTPIETTVILYYSVVWLYQNAYLDYDNAVYLVVPVIYANVALQLQEDEAAIQSFQLFIVRTQELVETGALLPEVGQFFLELAQGAIHQLRPPDFVVNTTDDLNDGSCDATHCSLREALNAANSSPGPETIGFDISGPGPHTIQPTFGLPSITDPVVIDGYTQPGAMPNTNGPGLGSNAVLKIELDGTHAGGADGLFIIGANSTVRGLVINRFTGSFNNGISIRGAGATGNIVEGNFIGTDVTGTNAQGNVNGVLIEDAPGNTVGGTTRGARNLISGSSFGPGVEIIGSGATGNSVQGNLIGTDVAGTTSLANGSWGVMIQGGASDNTIGGTTAGARNLISGNDDISGNPGVGVRIQSPGTTGNVVQGNFIGTDVFGTSALGNLSGVVIGIEASGNLIGGTAVGAGNLISGNIGDGVAIFRSATNNFVQGNVIGADLTGTADLGNGRDGVNIQNLSSDNTIGGTTPQAANTIAFNQENGVGLFVLGGVSNAILANSIFENGNLGIDLDRDGVTPNDVGDGDTGLNNLQNFPVLTSAASSGGSTTIVGDLNSTNNTDFRLEFFTNAVCDPSDYGEGETFLGSTMVTTDGSGDAGFSVTFSEPVAVGQFITATATDTDNNTSEFSQCRAVE